MGKKKEKPLPFGGRLYKKQRSKLKRLSKAATRFEEREVSEAEINRRAIDAY
jgi:hypothetical protein